MNYGFPDFTFMNLYDLISIDKIFECEFSKPLLLLTDNLRQSNFKCKYSGFLSVELLNYYW